jgi:hypothetical protein
MDVLYAFVASRDELNPLDAPALSYIPCLALLAALTSWLPQGRALIPAFVSDDEAQQVAEKRARAVEKRTGRPVRLGREGFARQSRRLRYILMLGSSELLGWSGLTGFRQDWMRGLPTSAAWVSMTATAVESSTMLTY